MPFMKFVYCVTIGSRRPSRVSTMAIWRGSQFLPHITLAGDEGTAKNSPKTMMLIAIRVATPTRMRRVRNRTMGNTYPMETAAPGAGGLLVGDHPHPPNGVAWLLATTVA